MQQQFIDAFKEALEIEGGVQLTDNFRDYDEWDSLARLSLIAMLDDEYGIQIEDAKFEQLKTVGDLIAAVEQAA
ncbi:acyl carrier protein [Flavilitoribacter nigricans]|uniref:Acyl carrier protein n=1 Tax=Flavilitoribacter nigricans (strain ATCC 23147 / DSM 23189 / NBRC 102662 / NCIMB 1420 / SS-2) TaxID=1122177 RepID=A0A2D0N188_FLAN2|nr:acyl carrier protein [Flavilitoribacter nigricans]PHN01483.1 acyl carrier protein [Flavilitoribacter nigricans DSM 23189 = NBRC 102662]